MRKEELAGLRWADVDFKAKTIQVNQVALTVYKKGVIMSEPKKDESRRTIELSNVTVQALKRHKEKQEKIQYALVAQWIERLTSDQMVVGSTPAEGICSRRNANQVPDRIYSIGDLSVPRFAMPPSLC